jgi:hypothetical protein
MLIINLGAVSTTALSRILRFETLSKAHVRAREYLQKSSLALFNVHVQYCVPAPCALNTNVRFVNGSQQNFALYQLFI